MQNISIGLTIVTYSSDYINIDEMIHLLKIN